MSSSKDKAERARAVAQAQVRRQERRTRTVILAVAAAVLVAFSAIVFFIVNSGKVPTLEEAHAPAAADPTGGIGVTADGVATASLPGEAVRVDLYLDYMCPWCERLELAVGPELAAMREEGLIDLYVHPLSVNDSRSAGSKYPTRAASAAGVVADRAPEHFMAFHDALFANQPEEGTVGLDDDAIAAIAVGVGVPRDVADSFADYEFAPWVTAATEATSAIGIRGTPSVAVAGELLDPAQVDYFTPSALRAYIEAQA